MLRKLISKVKAMLGVGPEKIELHFNPEGEFDEVKRALIVMRNRFYYNRRHDGMTSYQKWHKANKKWRAKG